VNNLLLVKAVGERFILNCLACAITGNLYVVLTSLLLFNSKKLIVNNNNLEMAIIRSRPKISTTQKTPKNKTW